MHAHIGEDNLTNLTKVLNDITNSDNLNSFKRNCYITIEQYYNNNKSYESQNTSAITGTGNNL